MTTTTVKTYKNGKAFSADALRMARSGYQVVSSFQEPSKNKPLRNLLKVPVGGAWVWGASIKGGKIVVTYQAFGPTVMAAGMVAPGAGAGVAPMAPTAPPVRGFAALHPLLRVLLLTLAVLGLVLLMVHGTL